MMKTLAAGLLSAILAFGVGLNEASDPLESETAHVVGGLFAPEILDLVSVPFVGDGECQYCFKCNDEPLRHEAVDWDNDPEYWVQFQPSHDATHACTKEVSQGDCFDTHTQVTSEECGEILAVHDGGTENVLLHELLNAMVAAAPAELTALIEANPTVLKLNPVRSAIQVYGCSGALVAHLPLRPGALTGAGSTQ